MLVEYKRTSRVFQSISTEAAFYSLHQASNKTRKAASTMNKWRLLLLSIFALLHITTSERIFIDGRCCDHTRPSPHGTRLPVFDSNREIRYLPETRNLNDLNKYLSTDGPDADISLLSRRSLIQYRDRLNNRQEDSSRVIARHRIRLLSSIPEIVRERQISRQRINERIDDIRTGFRDESFSGQHDRQYRRDAHLTSRTDFQRDSKTGTRFDIQQLNNNHRDNRRIAEQLSQRNNNFYDIAERSAVREEPGLCTSRKTHERSIVRNTRYSGNERHSRFAMLINDRGDNSEYKENGRIRPATRHTIQRNSGVTTLKDNRERTTLGIIRADNIHKRDARDTKTLVFRKTRDQYRDYSENRVERSTRTNNAQRRIVNGNDESTRINRRQLQRGYLDSIRDTRIQTQLSERDSLADKTGRIERAIQKRSLSEDVIMNRDTHIEHRRNIDNRNSRQYLERRKTPESRIIYNKEKEGTNRFVRLNENRNSEGKDVRANTENRLDIRRDDLEKKNARDNENREIRRNLLVQENAVRMESRRSYANQRNVNDAAIRMTRRNRKLHLSSDSRESRSSIESRQVDLRERRITVQIDRVNVRRDATTHRINDNRRDRFENEYRLRVRQNQNRITLRIRVKTSERANDSEGLIDNRSRLNSRRFSNEDRLTRRQVIRNVYEVIRNTKNTEGKRIDIQRITTYRDRRFKTEFEYNQRTIQMTPEIKQADVFEVKWQYLFYIVQAFYLCILLIKIPKDNERGKHNLKYTNWLTPTGLMKID